jgi:hypothetical protein
MPESKKEDKDTCLYCAHCRVCAIFIGVQPLFMKWEKDPPIDPRDLFKVCNAKLPVLAEQNGGPAGLAVPELVK